MEYEQWLEILGIINADNNLNESNVIEKIKEKLKATDLGTYEEWERTGFGVDKYFTGSTLLHLATRSGNTYAINALVKQGAEVNVEDCDKYTPLHWAVEFDYKDAINALLEAKANVNARDRHGRTPLHLAVQFGYKDATEVLIQKILIQDFSVQKPDYLTGASSTYWDKCKNKIEGKIGDSNTSYLDLLKADEDKIAIYLVNDELKKTMDELNYEGEFSILESQIRNKFNKEVERRELIDKPSTKIDETREEQGITGNGRRQKV